MNVLFEMKKKCTKIYRLYSSYTSIYIWLYFIKLFLYLLSTSLKKKKNYIIIDSYKHIIIIIIDFIYFQESIYNDSSTEENP